MQSRTSHSSLRPFGLCVVLLLMSTQSWAVCVSGNCVNGQGTNTWSNGDKYVGEWTNFKRNGRGTSTYADGGKYVGEYRYGKKHGQGTYTSADGRVKEGIWEDNNYLAATETEAEAKRERKRRAAEAERERKRIAAEAERERERKRIAKEKYDRIYNACVLSESDGRDMQARMVQKAIYKTCNDIAEDPSWLDKLRYD
jgi:hypothetical protein